VINLLKQNLEKILTKADISQAITEFKKEIGKTKVICKTIRGRRPVQDSVAINNCKGRDAPLAVGQAMVQFLTSPAFKDLKTNIKKYDTIKSHVSLRIISHLFTYYCSSLPKITYTVNTVKNTQHRKTVFVVTEENAPDLYKYLSQRPMFKKEVDKDGKTTYVETTAKDKSLSLIEVSDIKTESIKRHGELFGDSNTIINRTSGLPDGKDLEKLSEAVPEDAYLLLSFDFMAFRPLDTLKVKNPDQATKNNVVDLSLAVHDYVKRTAKQPVKVVKQEKKR